MIDWFKGRYSVNVSEMKRSEIRELLKLTRRPEIISFAGGLPSPETFPVEEIAELSRDLILREGHWALQYGPTEGDARLKEQIIRFMAKDGIRLEPENLLIVSASQQALDMTARLFLNRGDAVMLGRPSYVGALGAFRACGARFEGIDLDEQGMRTDLVKNALERMRRAGDSPKFIYEVPDFQNPAGITLSLARRRELLDLAREYRVLLVEDSPYRSLRYVGETLPSLYQLDGGEGGVMGLYTFSKIMFPGLRLGWIIAHPDIIDKLVVMKQAMDLCTPPFTQAVAYEYCRRGLLEPRIRKNVELYRKKREVMLQALEKTMPKQPDLCWTRPEGGLFLWIKVPPSIDTDEMFRQAIGENVAYVVGSCFYADGGGHDAMRLNFSYPSEDEIIEGIRRLAGVIKKNL